MQMHIRSLNQSNKNTHDSNEWASKQFNFSWLWFIRLWDPWTIVLNIGWQNMGNSFSSCFQSVYGDLCWTLIIWGHRPRKRSVSGTGKIRALIKDLQSETLTVSFFNDLLSFYSIFSLIPEGSPGFLTFLPSHSSILKNVCGSKYLIVWWFHW